MNQIAIDENMEKTIEMNLVEGVVDEATVNTALMETLVDAAAEEELAGEHHDRGIANAGQNEEATEKLGTSERIDTSNEGPVIPVEEVPESEDVVEGLLTEEATGKDMSEVEREASPIVSPSDKEPAFEDPALDKITIDENMEKTVERNLAEAVADEATVNTALKETSVVVAAEGEVSGEYHDSSIANAGHDEEATEKLDANEGIARAGHDKQATEKLDAKEQIDSSHEEPVIPVEKVQKSDDVAEALPNEEATGKTTSLPERDASIINSPSGEESASEGPALDRISIDENMEKMVERNLSEATIDEAAVNLSPKEKLVDGAAEEEHSGEPHERRIANAANHEDATEKLDANGSIRSVIPVEEEPESEDVVEGLPTEEAIGQDMSEVERAASTIMSQSFEDSASGDPASDKIAIDENIEKAVERNFAEAAVDEVTIRAALKETSAVAVAEEELAGEDHDRSIANASHDEEATEKLNANEQIDSSHEEPFIPFEKAPESEDVAEALPTEEATGKDMSEVERDTSTIVSVSSEDLSSEDAASDKIVIDENMEKVVERNLAEAAFDEATADAALNETSVVAAAEEELSGEDHGNGITNAEHDEEATEKLDATELIDSSHEEPFFPVEKVPEDVAAALPNEQATGQDMSEVERQASTIDSLSGEERASEPSEHPALDKIAIDENTEKVVERNLAEGAVDEATVIVALKETSVGAAAEEELSAEDHGNGMANAVHDEEATEKLHVDDRIDVSHEESVIPVEEVPESEDVAEAIPNEQATGQDMSEVERDASSIGSQSGEEPASEDPGLDKIAIDENSDKAIERNLVEGEVDEATVIVALKETSVVTAAEDEVAGNHDSGIANATHDEEATEKLDANERIDFSHEEPVIPVAEALPNEEASGKDVSQAERDASTIESPCGQEPASEDPALDKISIDENSDEAVERNLADGAVDEATVIVGLKETSVVAEAEEELSGEDHDGGIANAARDEEATENLDANDRIDFSHGEPVIPVEEVPEYEDVAEALPNEEASGKDVSQGERDASTIESPCAEEAASKDPALDKIANQSCDKAVERNLAERAVDRSTVIAALKETSVVAADEEEVSREDHVKGIGNAAHDEEAAENLDGNGRIDFSHEEPVIPVEEVPESEDIAEAFPTEETIGQDMIEVERDASSIDSQSGEELASNDPTLDKIAIDEKIENAFKWSVAEGAVDEATVIVDLKETSELAAAEEELSSEDHNRGIANAAHNEEATENLDANDRIDFSNEEPVIPVEEASESEDIAEVLPNEEASGKDVSQAERHGTAIESPSADEPASEDPALDKIAVDENIENAVERNLAQGGVDEAAVIVALNETSVVATAEEELSGEYHDRDIANAARDEEAAANLDANDRIDFAHEEKVIPVEEVPESEDVAEPFPTEETIGKEMSEVEREVSSFPSQSGEEPASKDPALDKIAINENIENAVEWSLAAGAVDEATVIVALKETSAVAAAEEVVSGEDHDRGIANAQHDEEEPEKLDANERIYFSHEEPVIPVEEVPEYEDVAEALPNEEASGKDVSQAERDASTIESSCAEEPDSEHPALDKIASDENSDKAVERNLAEGAVDEGTVIVALKEKSVVTVAEEEDAGEDHDKAIANANDRIDFSHEEPVIPVEEVPEPEDVAEVFPTEGRTCQDMSEVERDVSSIDSQSGEEPASEDPALDKITIDENIENAVEWSLAEGAVDEATVIVALKETSVGAAAEEELSGEAHNRGIANAAHDEEATENLDANDRIDVSHEEVPESEDVAEAIPNEQATGQEMSEVEREASSIGSQSGEEPASEDPGLDKIAIDENSDKAVERNLVEGAVDEATVIVALKEISVVTAAEDELAGNHDSGIANAAHDEEATEKLDGNERIDFSHQEPVIPVEEAPESEDVAEAIPNKEATGKNTSQAEREPSTIDSADLASEDPASDKIAIDKNIEKEVERNLAEAAVDDEGTVIAALKETTVVIAAEEELSGEDHDRGIANAQHDEEEPEKLDANERIDSSHEEPVIPVEEVPEYEDVAEALPNEGANGKDVSQAESDSSAIESSCAEEPDSVHPALDKIASDENSDKVVERNLAEGAVDEVIVIVALKEKSVVTVAEEEDAGEDHDKAIANANDRIDFSHEEPVIPVEEVPEPEDVAEVFPTEERTCQDMSEVERDVSSIDSQSGEEPASEDPALDKITIDENIENAVEWSLAEGAVDEATVIVALKETSVGAAAEEELSGEAHNRGIANAAHDEEATENLDANDRLDVSHEEPVIPVEEVPESEDVAEAIPDEQATGQDMSEVEREASSIGSQSGEEPASEDPGLDKIAIDEKSDKAVERNLVEAAVDEATVIVALKETSVVTAAEDEIAGNHDSGIANAAHDEEATEKLDANERIDFSHQEPVIPVEEAPESEDVAEAIPNKEATGKNTSQAEREPSTIDSADLASEDPASDKIAIDENIEKVVERNLVEAAVESSCAEEPDSEHPALDKIPIDENMEKTVERDLAEAVVDEATVHTALMETLVDAAAEEELCGELHDGGVANVDHDLEAREKLEGNEQIDSSHEEPVIPVEKVPKSPDVAEALQTEEATGKAKSRADRDASTIDLPSLDSAPVALERDPSSDDTPLLPKDKPTQDGTLTDSSRDPENTTRDVGAVTLEDANKEREATISVGQEDAAEEMLPGNKEVPTSSDSIVASSVTTHDVENDKRVHGTKEKATVLDRVLDGFGSGEEKADFRNKPILRVDAGKENRGISITIVSKEQWAPDWVVDDIQQLMQGMSNDDRDGEEKDEHGGFDAAAYLEWLEDGWEKEISSPDDSESPGDDTENPDDLEAVGVPSSPNLVNHSISRNGSEHELVKEGGKYVESWGSNQVCDPKKPENPSNTGIIALG